MKTSALQKESRKTTYIQTGGKKKVVSLMSDRGFVCRMYKEFSKFSEKTDNRIKIRQYFNRHITKKVVQMANKHMKKCSTALFTREMYI